MLVADHRELAIKTRRVQMYLLVGVVSAGLALCCSGIVLALSYRPLLRFAYHDYMALHARWPALIGLHHVSGFAFIALSALLAGLSGVKKACFLLLLGFLLYCVLLYSADVMSLRTIFIGDLGATEPDRVAANQEGSNGVLSQRALWIFYGLHVGTPILWLAFIVSLCLRRWRQGLHSR